jgi:hypothetical protein
MTTIAEFSETLHHLLTTCANRIARDSGFIRRERQVTGAGFAQTLVLGGLAQPSGTRKQLHHSAIQAGMPISVQGLDQRFTPSAVTFMRTLLEEGLNCLVTSPQTRGILPQFAGVYVTDCSRVTWAKTGVKVAVRLELQYGGLQAHLADLHTHDQKTGVIDQSLPAGSLHLGDLGFFKLSRFARWNEQGVYWLSRFKVGTTLTGLDGEPLDLTQLLTGDQPLCLPVKVGKRQPVTAFLLAAPVSGAALARRQARLKEQARLDQRPLSQRQAALAHWTIYLSNIPDLSFEQAFTLARIRWQIELLFKLWKSHGNIMTSRSADPVRQQVEGYARLLGVLIAHWLLLVTGWHQDRLGALDALRLVRTYLPLMQRAFIYRNLFDHLFHWLCLDMAAAPSLGKRHTTPLAFQLWRSLETPSP